MCLGRLYVSNFMRQLVGCRSFRQIFYRNIWKTEEHAHAGLMGCYNALMPWRSLHTMEFDMLTANAMPYNEANGTQAIGKGEHLSTTALIGSLWKNCYTGIGRANTFIANMPTVEMEEKG